MPALPIKEKYCLLKILEGSPLQLANVRALLSGIRYIEVENLFIISCTKTLKKELVKSLVTQVINHILVYVNNKAGCDATNLGLSQSDDDEIKKIILDE